MEDECAIKVSRVSSVCRWHCPCVQKGRIHRCQSAYWDPHPSDRPAMTLPPSGWAYPAEGFWLLLRSSPCLIQKKMTLWSNWMCSSTFARPWESTVFFTKPLECLSWPVRPVLSWMSVDALCCSAACIVVICGSGVSCGLTQVRALALFWLSYWKLLLLPPSVACPGSVLILCFFTLVTGALLNRYIFHGYKNYENLICIFIARVCRMVIIRRSLNL